MTLRERVAGLGSGGVASMAAALVLLLVAVFMPPLEVPGETYDYIMVFDISQSMNVEDYELDGKPVNRLSFAKAAARNAMRSLPCGSRVGWGIFTEYRTLLLLDPVEVCENYGDLVASLEQIDGRMRWGNSSEISKGVFWSMRAIKDAAPASDRAALVFFTDGQEAPPIDPKYPPRMFEDLKAGEVQGWIVGTGGDTPRRIPRTDEEGRRIGYWRINEVLQRRGEPTPANPTGRPMEHLSSLREGHLESLAQHTGLGYARLETAASLASLLQDPRLSHRQLARTEVFWLPASTALLLLVFRFLPPLRPSLGQRRGRN